MRYTIYRKDLNEHGVMTQTREISVDESELQTQLDIVLAGLAWVKDNEFIYKAYRRQQTDNGWGNVLFAYVYVEEECDHNFDTQDSTCPEVWQCSKCGEIEIFEERGFAVLDDCDPGYEPDDYEYPEGYNPFTDDRIEYL